MKYEVLVEVRLRPGIADPQGATIERALPALGFDGVDERAGGQGHPLDGRGRRRRGRRPGRGRARWRDRLLANPVIEDADVEIGARRVAGGSRYVPTRWVG